MNTFSASLFQATVDEKNNFFLSMATIVGIVMGSGLFFFSIEPRLSLLVGCLSFLIVYVVTNLMVGLSLRPAFEKQSLKRLVMLGWR
jgi:divalent metal cation (Fe/Co/Zn/Cd) transporter